MTGFFLSKDGELHVGRLQDARERHRDLLRPIVEAAHASHPEEDVGLLAGRSHFGHGGDVHPLGPLLTVRGAEGPRATVALKAREGWLQLLGEARLHQHEIAPELIDDVELVDADRAFLHAGPAARARPQLLFGDPVVEQLLVEHRLLLGRGRPAARCHEVQHAGLLREARTRLHHDHARRERLARDVGRAGRRAAAALGARVPVEQVLPREVLHIGGTKLLGVLRFEVHGTHRAHTPRPARVGEPHVDERREHVQVLRRGEVIKEPEDQHRVDPPHHPGHRMRRLGAHPAEERQQHRRDHAASRVGARLLCLPHEHQQQREHERSNHAQDQHRLPTVHRIHGEALRLDDQAPV